MKKLIALILTVMLIVSVCPLGAFNFTASAATSGKTGDGTWTLDGTVLTISGNGAMANYSSSSTLPWGKNITEVIIEAGVTSIGDYAFFECNSLTSVTIPDSVTSIGSYAFYKCSSLTDTYITDIAAWCNIKFGSGNANPMYYAENLYLNGKLVTKLEIPDSVTSIDRYAFYNCSSLTSVTIPDSVTSIGDLVFKGCTSLTSVTVGKSVTSIGSYAFEYCSALTNVYITDIAAWCNIKFGSVNANPMYYAENLYLNGKLVTKLEIPDSVTSIGSYAFYNCSSLTSITIPDSVTSIGHSAFYDCSALTSITIPDSVTSIGHSAFYGCTSLESITLPFIGSSRNAGGTYDAVFGYIFGYSSSSGSGKVKQNYSYSSYEYYNIPSTLKTVIITDATQIPYGAFYNCSNFTSITIPKSVTSIGGSAFSGCDNLDRVDIADLEAWSNIKFGTVDANPMYFAENLYLNNQLVTEITVPETQIINECSYYNIKSLKNVFLPKELVLVKQDAFYGCSGLQNVCFEGTAEEWAAVTVLSGNDYLKNANVYFNCTSDITGVAVTKLPEKLQYIERKETLDLTGGVLTLYYDGGAIKDIDLATLNVTGFDNTKLGKQTITVKYGAFSVQFEIEVIERPKTFVAIISLPDKNQYKFGESLDLTGGKIAVGYSDGTYETLDLTADMVSGYDLNDIGDQVLTVKYGSFSDIFIVSVINDGDLNGDGTVNILDLVKMKKTLAGIDTTSSLPLDFDGDGDQTAKDMIILMGIIIETNKK